MLVDHLLHVLLLGRKMTQFRCFDLFFAQVLRQTERWDQVFVTERLQSWLSWQSFRLVWIHRGWRANTSDLVVKAGFQHSFLVLVQYGRHQVLRSTTLHYMLMILSNRWLLSGMHLCIGGDACIFRVYIFQSVAEDENALACIMWLISFIPGLNLGSIWFFDLYSCCRLRLHLKWLDHTVLGPLLHVLRRLSYVLHRTGLVESSCCLALFGIFDWVFEIR